MKLKIFILLCMMALMSFAYAAPVQDADSAIATIRVDGDRLIDGAGRHVILRGVNAGGRSKLPPFFPFDPKPDFDTALNRYADNIKSLGFNVVRLLIIYEAAEPVRGQYDERYLAIYDRLVEAFTQRKIYMIVDSHQDLFSRRFCGDGFPDWALPEQYRNLPQHADCKLWSLKYFGDPVSEAFDRFWANEDGLQESYTAFFKMLAARYRDNPYVVGFEPINEPMPGKKGRNEYEKWHGQLYALYEKVADAIHSVDARYLIFTDIAAAENTGTRNASRKKPNVANLVFSPHYYDPGTFGISISPGGDRWLMAKGLNKHLAQAKNWGVPMVVTEYGISPRFHEAPTYIRKIYSVFDELQLSGTFWEASMSETIWNAENTSLFEADGAVRPASYNLDRPYPRAVAGKIISFSFDAKSGVFEIEWAEGAEAKLPTGIYIPIRHCSQTPRVTLSPDGEFNFVRETGMLSITPMGKESKRRATIKLYCE